MREAAIGRLLFTVGQCLNVSECEGLTPEKHLCGGRFGTGDGEFLREELAGVTRPGRYLGIEVNTYRKPFESAEVTCALVYPDAYEIGMSHLGLSILYEEINERDDAMADRAYLPWVDMQESMGRRGAALFGLESRVPLRDFDIVGITLQHELTYANVVRVLGLAGITPLAAERGDEVPLVVGGGPGAYNPEPLAELFDVLVLGEGEEVIHELIDLLKEWKKKGGSRREELIKGMRRHPRCLCTVPLSGELPAWRRDRCNRASGGRCLSRTQAPARGPQHQASSQAPGDPVGGAGARPLQPGGVPGMHARMPLLPGGDGLSSGAGEAGGDAV